MSNDDHTLETLKRLVCEGAGVAAHTPGDFYTIMAFVEGRTHEGIGLTTVKRLWQYGGLSSKPRQATLDVLARSIGYRSYDDFATHYGRGGESSNIVLGGGIKVSDLFLGERLMLRWNPGREIVVEMRTAPPTLPKYTIKRRTKSRVSHSRLWTPKPSITS